MKIASVADVKANLSAYVKKTEAGPVVITRNGKAVAALVPLADEQDVEHLLISYSPKLRGLLSAARRRVNSGQKVAHDQFWRKAGTRKAGGHR